MGRLLAYCLLLGACGLGCELAAGIDDREAAKGASGGAGRSRWPDSPTVLCTDGEDFVDACPEPGQRGFGQDGSYRILVPEYHRVEGLTVDTVTGLEWESSSTNGTVGWDAAVARCENLQDGGRAWRLPTRLEIASLMDFGGWARVPGLSRGSHWSSSRSGDPSKAWMVSFLSDVQEPSPLDDEHFAICVSGEPFAGKRVTRSDAVFDGRTGLTWQREGPADEIDWFDALNLCEGLELAEKEDWRLASVKELLTIVEDDQTLAPGLDAEPGDEYWTSSPDIEPNRAYSVQFPFGDIGATDVAFRHLVRCVRGP